MIRSKLIYWQLWISSKTKELKKITHSMNWNNCWLISKIHLITINIIYIFMILNPLYKKLSSKKHKKLWLERVQCRDCSDWTVLCSNEEAGEVITNRISHSSQKSNNWYWIGLNLNRNRKILWYWVRVEQERVCCCWNWSRNSTSINNFHNIYWCIICSEICQVSISDSCNSNCVNI